MDVRGPLAQGLHEHQVDQLDDGRVVIRIEQILDTPAVLHQAGEFRFFTQAVEQAAGILALGVAGGERCGEGFFAQHGHQKGQAVMAAQLGQDFRLGISPHRDGQPARSVGRSQHTGRAGIGVGNPFHESLPCLKGQIRARSAPAVGSAGNAAAGW